MSRIKSLIQIISACDKPEFDTIVKSYLREIYGYKRIVVTDGKDDLGMDIKVFDHLNQKFQYQVTIMKSSNASEQTKFQAKLFDDVQKANRNVKDYGYSPNLYFFYSYVLTEKKKNNFRREALNSYNIYLEIIDANQIASESEEYIKLQKDIYACSGLNDFDKNNNDKKEQNLIYDLLSFGKAVDVKISIVECFIQQCLYNKGGLKCDEIIKLCMEKFHSKENNTFYNKLINKMYNDDRILIYCREDKKYHLTDNKKIEIETGTQQILLDEQLFENKLKELLSDYNQEDFFNVYYKFLYELYINNFNKRINLSSDIDNIELSPIINFSKNKLGDPVKAKNMISKALNICDENKYLQKKCASVIFSGQFDIDNLQKYAVSQKRVFIDTTIALYLLCVFYKKIDSYDNFYYKLSNAIGDFCKKNDIKLYIPDRYIWEIESHVRDALRLEPFTVMPAFTSLGGSRNVLYNYYLYLYNEKVIFCNFGDFLNGLNFKSSHSKTTIEQYITQYLGNLNINVVKIEKKYDIQKTKTIIENQLMNSGRNKTPFGLSNDAIILEYLADTDVSIHPIAPIFVTWDKTLFELRTKFFDINPISQRWMQFTPSQFIDRYALLSFSIDEETISKEMLAMLSGSLIQDTHSLLDSLSLILNPKDEAGMEYLSRFTKMKDSNIYMTNTTSGAIPEDKTKHVLDDLVYFITNHYITDEKNMKNLRTLFANKDYVDKVMDLIMENATYILKNDKINDSIFENIDELIKEI